MKECVCNTYRLGKNTYRLGKRYQSSQKVMRRKVCLGTGVGGGEQEAY